MALNNKVTLIGNLGAEATTHGEEGKLFAAFSLATRDSYQDKDENWQQKEVVWHRVLVFNKNVVELAKSFKKGARLEITGSLSYRPFEIKGRGKKTLTKQESTIIAHKIEPRPLAKKNREPVPA